MIMILYHWTAIKPEVDMATTYQKKYVCSDKKKCVLITLNTVYVEHRHYLVQ